MWNVVTVLILIRGLEGRLEDGWEAEIEFGIMFYLAVVPDLSLLLPIT